MNNFFVYGLVDPRTRNIRYVGRASNMKRPKEHRVLARQGQRGHKACWIRSLLQQGLEYQISILERGLTHEKCCREEKFWIAEGRARGWDLTNVSDGGEGNPGLRHTDEAKARISRANRGRKMSDENRARLVASNTGRKHSAETKLKMSLWQKGKPKKKPSAETRARMSEAHRGKPGTMLGRKMSDETRRKMSLAHIGKPGTMTGRKHTEEAKLKMSLARTGVFRDRNGEGRFV